MKKKWIITISLILVFILVPGCLGMNPKVNQTQAPETNEQNEENEQPSIESTAVGTEPPAELPSPAAPEAPAAEEGPAQGQEMTLGSIRHEPVNPDLDKDGRAKPFQYNGGEFELDYQAQVDGPVKNWGFMIYLNGIPQPYKVDSSDAKYEYMHQFTFEDRKMTPFKFFFTPVTGNPGETLDLYVASVFYPAFIPDLIQSKSYGLYHSFLESINQLTINQAPDPIDKTALPALDKKLSNVAYTQETVTAEQKEKKQIDDEMLKTQVFTELFIEGADMELGNKLQLNGARKLHLTYKLFGHPGVKYDTTLYLDHQPLASEEGASFESVIEENGVAVIDLDLDVADIKSASTFYLVSVPSNASDFPQDFLPVIKSNSILLYE